MPRAPPPPDGDEVKAAILASLFSRTDSEGHSEENLVDYLEVHENDSGGAKTRFLILAVTKMGKCVMHKARRNSNGSFSVGKTWSLDDTRQVEQLGPLHFALTMTQRTYQWTTDNRGDLTVFLNNFVQMYRKSRGQNPPLVNFIPSDAGLGHAPQPPGQPYGGHRQHPSVSSLAPSVAPSVAQSHGGSLGRPPSRGSGGTSPMIPPASMVHSATPASSRMRGAGTSSASPGSQHSDLLPPRGLGRGERSGSFSSDAGRSVGSSDGFEGRKALVSSGGPAAARNGATTPSGPSNTAGVGNYGIGLGRPGSRRQGSGGDDRLPVDQRLASATSNYPNNNQTQIGMARRPSGSSIPPIHEPLNEEDPYGGMEMEEEVLIPPVSVQPPDEPEVLIPPVVNEPPSETGRRTPATRSEPLPHDSSLGPPGSSLAPPQAREQPVSSDNPQRRVSFHPPPLTTAYSRDVLLTSRTGYLGAEIMLADDDDDEAGDAIMANVEEMIEGFDWTAATAATGEARSKGTDAIEGRLLDELSALESANIHAFLESDDRIDQVLSHIDEALAELDDIDMQLTGYRMQLDVVSEDIQYIEGQNRGLQVQTSNQHALLNEMRQLLQITDVPKEDLQKLLQLSPSTKRGVQDLELAAASLYKALQASRDTANEVAATVAHIQEYRAASTTFSTRILEYLDIAFKHQSDQTLADYRKETATKRSLKLIPHMTLGQSLMTYEGLVLYVKDMDEDKYKKLCLNYITTISKLHQSEMSELLMNLIKALKPNQNGATDVAFAKAAGAPVKSTAIGAGVVRSKTVSRRPNHNGSKAKEKEGDVATRKVSEMYSLGMGEVVSQIVTEDDFINAFLHLADTESTFADYMELDTYFRRQAARHASGLSSSLAQIARSVMDLMFGFVDGEFKNWIDAAIQNNTAAIVGIIATTEQLHSDAQQEGTSLFLLQFLEKQLGRQRQVFDAFINEQVKAIDGAKISIKKRRGVFYFVRHFPVFVDRIECQLDNCDELQVRKRVNDAYERVVASVLGSLQHVSKIVAAETSSGEDKGQLYFHVVMIENLHVFVEEGAHLNIPSLAVYLQRAKGLYEENRKAYIKMMLRRGFARLMDFFDGVERALKTMPANEVHLHSSYNRSALKKVLKDSGAKDMRKSVEAMARRVDKHFTHDDESSSGIGGGGVGGVGGQGHGASSGGAHDPATQALIASMWREISSELRRETQRAADYIAKSYADAGLQLEYNARDVEAVCVKTKRAA